MQPKLLLLLVLGLSLSSGYAVKYDWWNKLSGQEGSYGQSTRHHPKTAGNSSSSSERQSKPSTPNFWETKKFLKRSDRVASPKDSWEEERPLRQAFRSYEYQEQFDKPGTWEDNEDDNSPLKRRYSDKSSRAPLKSDPYSDLLEKRKVGQFKDSYNSDKSLQKEKVLWDDKVEFPVKQTLPKKADQQEEDATTSSWYEKPTPGSIRSSYNHYQVSKAVIEEKPSRLSSRYGTPSRQVAKSSYDVERASQVDDGYDDRSSRHSEKASDTYDEALARNVETTTYSERAALEDGYDDEPAPLKKPSYGSYKDKAPRQASRTGYAARVKAKYAAPLRQTEREGKTSPNTKGAVKRSNARQTQYFNWKTDDEAANVRADNYGDEESDKLREPYGDEEDDTTVVGDRDSERESLEDSWEAKGAVRQKSGDYENKASKQLDRDTYDSYSNQAVKSEKQGSAKDSYNEKSSRQTDNYSWSTSIDHSDKSQLNNDYKSSSRQTAGYNKPSAKQTSGYADNKPSSRQTSGYSSKKLSGKQTTGYSDSSARLQKKSGWSPAAQKQSSPYDYPAPAPVKAQANAYAAPVKASQNDYSDRAQIKSQPNYGDTEVLDQIQQKYEDENRSSPQSENPEDDHEGGAPCRLEDAIPGTPETDYPTFTAIPDTAFACSDHQLPGYYGDPEAQCQVFHVCQADGRKDSFLCPVGTIFNQQLFVCDWWNNFRCEDTASLYELNANLFVTNGQSAPQRDSRGYGSDSKAANREYQSENLSNESEYPENEPSAKFQKRSQQKEQVYFDQEVEDKKPQRQASYGNQSQRSRSGASYGRRTKAKARTSGQLREYDNWAAASDESKTSTESEERAATITSSQPSLSTTTPTDTSTETA